MIRTAHIRLGCGKGGTRDVCNHAFFESIEWPELEAKRVKVPYTPNIKSPTDTSNFDQFSASDEGAHWDRYNDPAKEKVWVEEFSSLTGA